MTKVTDENEIRANGAGRMLCDFIGQKIMNQKLTASLLDELKEVIKDHRAKCKLVGIDFPEMTVMPVITDRGAAVELVRADMEPKGIETTVVNLTVKYPWITPRQLAEAVYYAFPSYKIGNGRERHPRLMDSTSLTQH